MNRYQAFLEALAAEEPARVYAFLGEEDLLKDEAEEVLVGRLTKLHGRRPERVALQARDAGPDDVEQAVSYASLFGGPRLVVVGDMDEWSAERQKSLLGFLKEHEPAPGMTLLLRGAMKKLPVTVKGLSTYVFWKFFPRDLVRWVEKRLRSRGLDPERDVAGLLVDRYAGEDVKNLRLLAAEVDKLALYTGGAGTVTADLVERVCSAPPQGEWFRFVDAVIGRRCREALALSATFLVPDPRGAVGFLAVLGARLVDLAAVKSVAGSVGDEWRQMVSGCRRRSSPRLRRPERDAIDREVAALRDRLVEPLPVALGEAVSSWAPWTLCSRVLEAEGFSMRELADAIRLTADVECRLKSGRGDPLAEVDVLITAVCVQGLAARLV